MKTYKQAKEEARKIRYAEWAAENGMSIKDYEKVRVYKRNGAFASLWLVFWIILLGVCLMISVHRYENAAYHCVKLYSNETVGKVIDVCGGMFK